MAIPYTELNPNLPVNEPQNTLNYSRGYDATREATTAIKVAGDLLDMGVKATDQFIKQRSTEEITAAVDAERDRTAQEASEISTRKDLANSGVPELADVNRQITDLAKARTQGVMRDSHYWARLELIARQARARYPGYREHIDNTISGLVGTTPANKLVTTLMNEAQARSHVGISEEDKFKRQYIKENEQWLPPGYAEAVAAGREPDFNTVRAYVIKNKQIKNNLEQKDLRITSETKDLDLQNKLIFEKARYDVGTKVSLALDPILTNIDKLALKAQDEIDRVGGLSPQTEAEVRKTLGTARVSLTRLMDTTLNDRAYLSMPRDQRNGIRQEFQDQLNSMETAFLNKDWGVLQARAASLKALQESDEALVLRNPEIALVGAINRIGGNQVANSVYSALFKEINEPASLNKQRAAIEASRLMLGYTTPLTSINNLARSNATPETIAATIRAPLNAILDPKTPPVIVDNLIKSYYGTPEQADQILKNAKSTKDRRAIFDALVNPEIAKAIRAHAERKGSNEAFNVYTTWATNAFVTNFKTELGTLDGIMTSPDISVKYQNGQFVASPSDEVAKRGTVDAAGRSALVVADRLSATLNGDRLVGINNSIKRMLPVWEAAGLDPNKAVGDILLTYRGNTRSSASGFESVISKVNRGFRETLDKLKTKGSVTTDADTLDTPIDTTQIDDGPSKDFVDKYGMTIERFNMLSRELDPIFKKISEEDKDFKFTSGMSFEEYVKNLQKQIK